MARGVQQEQSIDRSIGRRDAHRCSHQPRFDRKVSWLADLIVWMCPHAQQPLRGRIVAGWLLNAPPERLSKSGRARIHIRQARVNMSTCFACAFVCFPPPPFQKTKRQPNRLFCFSFFLLFTFSCLLARLFAWSSFCLLLVDGGCMDPLLLLVSVAVACLAYSLNEADTCMYVPSSSSCSCCCSFLLAYCWSSCCSHGDFEIKYWKHWGESIPPPRLN